MPIWELRNARINDFAVLVYDDPTALDFDMFEIDGKPKHWLYPPRVKAYVEKRRKNQKPRADISYLPPGTIVLGPTAYAALKDFLSPFGQLLALACDEREEYLYNVTNLRDSIDLANSQQVGGALVKEGFLSGAIPEGAQIFKDPRTARVRIYVNQAARTQLEELLSRHRLSGLTFAEPGAPQST